MNQPLILVVEDEAPMRQFLCATLKRRGYSAVGAATGSEGLSLARSHNPELILLDLGLPDRDGLDVLKDLRTWSEAPVLVLSARRQERQKVLALDLGADDYLAKPFGVMELLARIRVARRHTTRRDAPQPVMDFGDLRIDLDGRVVTRAGEGVHLTPLEFKLLAALARRQGKVVTHHQLLQEVWGPGQVEQTHYLHIKMGHLRQKLELDPTRPRHFLTEAGTGYRLKGNEDPDAWQEVEQD
jgi:two-component system KDP operon response regulator KdpE